jgi:hypothetical protein
VDKEEMKAPPGIQHPGNRHRRPAAIRAGGAVAHIT